MPSLPLSPLTFFLLLSSLLLTLTHAAVPTQKLPTSRDGTVVTLLNQGSFTGLSIAVGTDAVGNRAGTDPSRVSGGDIQGAPLNQKWRLKCVDKTKGYWVLKSQARAQVLEINDGSSSPGAQAQGWTPTTTDAKYNMMWEIYISYQGWDRILLSFKNVAGGLWLKLEAAKPTDSSNVIGSNWDDSTLNQWQPIIW